MVDVRASLGAHLHGMAAPFLFVGAGMSRRYASTDSWEGLLRNLATHTQHPYEYYRASAGGLFPEIASRIAQEFHEIWWSEDRYESSRRKWSSRLRGVESALKVEVAESLTDLVLPTSGIEAEEIAVFRDAVVDGVITTNYDHVLETIFPDFRVFVGQDGILFANPQGIAEIYKIHGSVEDPESLVLTAADYSRFEERNAYLAAKLLAVFVEHPVIFLGYSMADSNIRSILRSVANCLTQENVSELRDRLIFVQWEPGKDASLDSSIIVIDGFQLSVLRVSVPDYREVFKVLCELRRAFPAPLLRRLKEQVYELVLADDPNGRLFVSDIDDETNMAEVDVVFGVGMQDRITQQGYRGLDRWDLIWNVVKDDQVYEAEPIVREVLPHVLRAAGNVPVFKYLRGMGALAPDGTILAEKEISPKAPY